MLLLLLLLLLLGVTTRDATRDGCVFGGVCVLVCRVLCPFFFVFFVFLSCVTMTEREEERDLSAFSLSRGDRRQKKRRKSRKKKVAGCVRKEKKFKSITLPHSFKEARHVKRYAAHSIRKIRFYFKHKMN